jgi:predicted signal transduction protein with EAL and GGDEF domain
MFMTRVPDHFVALLKEGGISPSNVIIEVIEREAILDRRAAIDSMTRPRLHGVGLSIGDFGMGHSSLAELYRMSFSEVKIDASFVRDLSSVPEACKITRSVIELARELEIDCCAEGIDTIAQSAKHGLGHGAGISVRRRVFRQAFRRIAKHARWRRSGSVVAAGANREDLSGGCALG